MSTQKTPLFLAFATSDRSEPSRIIGKPVPRSEAESALKQNGFRHRHDEVNEDLWHSSQGSRHIGFLIEMDEAGQPVDQAKFDALMAQANIIR